MLNRLNITNEQDRQTVAAILFKNNYVVWKEKAKDVNKKTVTYICYEERKK